MRLGLELITRNWTLKLAALGLAVLLWGLTRAESPARVTIETVPVQVSLRDPSWTLAARPSPPQVQVTLTAAARELLPLIGEPPRVVVPVDEVADSTVLVQLQPAWVRLRDGPERARVEEIRPNTVRLSFERLDARLIGLAVRTRGELPGGLRLTGPPSAEPGAVRVSGPVSRLDRLDSLPLRPVDLSGLRDTTRLRVQVDTAGLGDLLVSPIEAQVLVPVAPVPVDTAAADTLPAAADTLPAAEDTAPEPGDTSPEPDTTSA